MKKVDVVIVTLVQDEKTVVDTILQKLETKIITIMELIRKVGEAYRIW